MSSKKLIQLVLSVLISLVCKHKDNALKEGAFSKKYLLVSSLHMHACMLYTTNNTVSVLECLQLTHTTTPRRNAIGTVPVPLCHWRGSAIPGLKRLPTQLLRTRCNIL